MIAASCGEERDAWLRDLRTAIDCQYCNRVFGFPRALVIAASCGEERDAWLRDLRTAIDSAMAQPDNTAPLSSSLLPACSTCTDALYTDPEL